MDGENEQKAYEEFEQFCNDESKEAQFAIKTGKADAERASASIAEAAAKIDGATAKIEELSSTIGTSEADLKSATEIRAAEKADFTKLDADLASTIDMLGRAHGIIEREMNKQSFVQTGSLSTITDALQEVINAARVNSADKAKVQALLETDDMELAPAGAPAPDAYESHSSGILQTLEDMLEKAKAQRADAQKAEMNADFDFKMLKQKLEDSIANNDKNMRDAKKAKAQAEEDKAVAEGELETANSQVAADEKRLHDLQSECMGRAESYETSQHERSNELAALQKAKDVLEEKAGGAADRTYSFVQLSASTKSKAKDTQDRVVEFLQGLAGSDKSMSLLASRIQSAMLVGADPFAKVKGMIQEMIEKLVAEAQKEASHKAFCDKEMSETKAKRDDKQIDVDVCSAKIDAATSKIAKLKEDIATLQSELAEIAAAQQKADKMRAEEGAAWKEAKADKMRAEEGAAWKG